MRPRKHLLLYADREQEASTLAYTLSVALHVTVDRVESSAALATALHARVYDLALLLDPSPGVEALTEAAAPAMPVLITSRDRIATNEVLLGTVARLLVRKRGPLSAVHPVRVFAKVA